MVKELHNNEMAASQTCDLLTARPLHQATLIIWNNQINQRPNAPTTRSSVTVKTAERYDK